MFDQLKHVYDITYFNAKCWWGYSPEDKNVTLPDPAQFEIIALHYTFLMRRQNPKFNILLNKIKWISDSPALKIAIPQDEGTCSHILDETLYLLGIDIIFSPHFSDDSPLYPLCRKTAFIQKCLLAYVHPNIESGIDHKIADRKMDIFYRARGEPLYFGESLYLKGKIAEVFEYEATKYDLKTSISTKVEDRMNGPEWFDALRNTKMVLGTYAGYNTINPYGERKDQFNYIGSTGDISDNKHVLKFLDKSEWNSCKLHALAPRHFEAIQAGTCQILIEDDYQGILKPNIHYIPIKKDFSNIEDVLNIAMDSEYLQTIADRAYKDIIKSNKYSRDVFANLIKNTINEFELQIESRRLVSKQERLDRLFTNSLKHKAIYEHRSMLIQIFGPSGGQNLLINSATINPPPPEKKTRNGKIKAMLEPYPLLFKSAKLIKKLIWNRKKHDNT